MDIKAKAEEIISKIKNDPGLAEKFKKSPVDTVKELLGIELPDDAVKNVVDIVKAKLSAGAVGDIASKIGGLFKK